jgi:hypothetical protein
LRAVEKLGSLWRRIRIGDCRWAFVRDLADERSLA